MSIRRVAVSVAAAALMSGGVLLATLDSASGAGCSTFASNPYKSGNTAYGAAGRTGCTDTVQIKTRLVHFQPYWADEVLASNSVWAVNQSFTNSGARSGSGQAKGWEFYTVGETSTGQKSTSSRITLWS